MSNTKKILKNTIVLYVRMVIVLIIALYTSRVVLQALGVDDFGLFNVVGGVVGLLTFFNGTMTKSTQKFLNVAMVRDSNSLPGIFASSISVHCLFVVVFLILGESLGLWFLNEKINIPENRLFAANIVYQATVFSFCISILTIPYNAVVIAFEKMTFIAFVSILDSILRLGIALLLINVSSDRLVLYALLLLLITVSDFFLYFFYCRKKHSKLRFALSMDKQNFKQIFSFVSWTLVGQFAVVGCNQGNVVLVNMFHSLAANSAMSIGSQINNAVIGLTTNFQTAFNPQITKSYAEGDNEYLKTLVYTTSKLSFFILMAVILPVAFNIDQILSVWLVEVPTLTNIFAILFLVNGIINAISMPFNFIVLSSDDIRNFQLVTAFVFMLDIPIAYILFSLGFPAPTILWVKICVITVMLFVRIYYASLKVGTIVVLSYCKKVLLPLVMISMVLVVICMMLNGNIQSLSLRLFYTLLIEAICFIMFWGVCLNRIEKQTILKYLKLYKNRL